MILALIIILVIIQKTSMKKKEIVNKALKSKSVQTAIKKTPIKVKSKSKDIKKQDAQFFVLLGDNFYAASSKTERRSYEQFQQKVKVASSGLKKGKGRGNSNFHESINLQEYVKTLSKEQKERLLRDLSKQIQVQKSNQPSVVEEKEDKMLRLTEKLESIKSQLIMRWDDQISKVNHSFQNEQIGLQEKNEKIMLIQKIKNNKIAMINYTTTLFAKILTEEPDIELEKSERMVNIINSLNSITSMDPRDPLNLVQLDPHNFMHFTDSANHHFHPQSQDEISKSPHSQHDFQREISDIIKIEDSKEESVNMSKEHLKLDLRLDQVEFGKDHYDDEVIFSKETPSKNIKEQTLILEFIGQKKDDVNAASPLDLPFSEPKGNLSQEFLCMGEEHQIQIPLLMTKDRLQQIQLEKTAKQVQILGLCIKNRKCFQTSEIIIQNSNHFTTLIDINQFIVQFYEFLMRTHLDEIIKGLNVPYGKSCADKLYTIRQEGYVPDFDHNNVIPESYLLEFYEELFVNRQDREVEKIHHLAVFHTFNIGLNVYRPYYELQGEVFPWITSEKGLTFYEISQDNIEEVFEKSKMKVLEYCSSLCGLMPECQVTTVQAKKQLVKMNEEVYDRVLKGELIQKYGEWGIKKVNFQAISKIFICDEIFKEIIDQECQVLLNQGNPNQLK